MNVYFKLLEINKTKDVGGSMCEVLEKLRGMSPEEILQKTGQINAAPVDLEKIIAFLGLKKFPTSFETLEKSKNKKNISGLVLLSGNDVGIFYKKTDSIEKKRFVIAHEIGHCCLHNEQLENGYIELLNNNGFENEHEIYATEFAMNLLIPEQRLKDITTKLLLPSVKSLSTIFQVPSFLMVKRMKNLHMAYYLDEKEKLVKPNL